MNVAIQGFYYGDEWIPFSRRDSKSVANKVTIKVKPDCTVQVAAPASASDKEVLAAVRKRGRWIYEQLRDFKAQQVHITPRKYVSGQSHYYLGKQYLLKVTVDAAAPRSVKLLRGQLLVSVRSQEPGSVRLPLEDWDKASAKEVVHMLVVAVLAHALWVAESPPVRLLTMHTQWGKCYPDGRIALVPLLVKTPLDCIDYVILHVLCDIAEHNVS